MLTYDELMSHIYTKYILDNQPSIVVKTEIDMTSSLKWIQMNRSYVEKKYNYHITITTLCIYAIYNSYILCPKFGARIEGENVVLPNRFDLGLIAMAGEKETQIGIIKFTDEDCKSVVNIGKKITSSRKRLERLYSHDHLVSEDVINKLELLSEKGKTWKTNTAPQIIISAVNAPGIDVTIPFLPVGIGQSFSIGHIYGDEENKKINIYCAFHPSACHGKVGMQFMSNVKQIIEHSDFRLE